jgi:hypothetical protein
VAATWLGGIAINLITTGHHFDIAIRDVVMAIPAFTLARLAEASGGAQARDRAGAPGRTPRGRSRPDGELRRLYFVWPTHGCREEQ